MTDKKHIETTETNMENSLDSAFNGGEDDALIEKFFHESTVSIADDGFSQRVMRRLPNRAQQYNRIWTALCSAAAMLACVIHFDAETFLGNAKGAIYSIITHDIILHSPWAIAATFLAATIYGSYKFSKI